MTSRLLALTGGVISAVAIGLAGIGAQAQGPAFRTPWGDPDIQGIFTTDDELGVPFERPQQFGGREVISDKEFEERQAQAQRQADVDAEEFIAPRTGRGGDGTGPPAHWLERGKPSRRTSIIIDPPDGRIPYLNDEARKRAATAVNQRTSGQRPYDGPESLDMYDRCITRGLPHVIFPTIYNNTFAKPWTAALSLKSGGMPDVFEYACHEGNYAMRNILSGARAAEKAGK